MRADKAGSAVELSLSAQTIQTLCGDAVCQAVCFSERCCVAYTNPTAATKQSSITHVSDKTELNISPVGTQLSALAQRVGASNTVSKTATRDKQVTLHPLVLLWNT